MSCVKTLSARTKITPTEVSAIFFGPSEPYFQCQKMFVSKSAFFSRIFALNYTNFSAKLALNRGNAAHFVALTSLPSFGVPLTKFTALLSVVSAMLFSASSVRNA